MISNTAKYLLVAFIYLLAYVYSIEIAPRLSTCERSACLQANSVHETCIIGCNEVTRPLTLGRGDNYLIGIEDPVKNERMKNCLVTFWGVAHFALYFVLGFTAPDMFWETFAIGVGFEIYENYKFDCHDVLDVGLNSAGFLLGRLFSG